MQQANQGDVVSVHYTGKLPDGTVFDSSVEREPLKFTIGDKQIIPGFEKAVVGMKPGESKSTKIPSDQAYGERDNNLIWEVEKNNLPEDMEPEVGQMLESVGSDGSRVTVMISEISESSVKLDGNHPLAGKDLVFEIELVEIQDQN